MSTTGSDGLPFLPGNAFKDPTRTRFHVCNTLKMKNGYRLPNRPTQGFGGDRLVHNQLSEQEIEELANLMPTLTYGKAKQQPPVTFVPSHVAFDKKVLLFKAFFKETVHESSLEYYRVRPVDIYYYLEDDSISVIEPRVENSGIPQGTLLKRQRLPKDDRGNYWHWTDFNLATDVVFYGRSFHVANCDQFTNELLMSQGMVVNPPEAMPPDPYMQTRIEPSHTFVTPSDWDQLRRFLTLDRKVLRFYCVWDDRDEMFGELLPFILHYFLVDDTIEVLEAHRPNDGRDPFPLLIRRQRIPKDRDNVVSSFPAIVMELSNHEIRDWFMAADFAIGKTVRLYGRRFLIYDCDEFTKNYLRRVRGQTDFTPVQVDGFAKELPKMLGFIKMDNTTKRAKKLAQLFSKRTFKDRISSVLKHSARSILTAKPLPPYNGFGSLEDSRQNCLSLRPQPVKKDYLKMLENQHKILRYEAKMDSKYPQDAGRRFIISYRLADDMMSIFELRQRNSGIIGGKFLEATRIPKPGSDPEYPDYYAPGDLAIGTSINVLKHRFIITGCDEYVWKMMQLIGDQCPMETIESIRKIHGNKDEEKEEEKDWDGVKQGDMWKVEGKIGGVMYEEKKKEGKKEETDGAKTEEAGKTEEVQTEKPPEEVNTGEIWRIDSDDYEPNAINKIEQNWQDGDARLIEDSKYGEKTVRFKE